MTDQKLSMHVFCPFFGNLNPRTISCEFLGQECGITVRFRSQTHKTRTLAGWCFSQEGHRSCPVAMANYRYYSRKERAEEAKRRMEAELEREKKEHG